AAGSRDAASHMLDGQRTESKLETLLGCAASPSFDVPLFEHRHATSAILPDRFDEREMGAASCAAAQLHAVAVLAPVRHVRHEIDAEPAARPQDACDGVQGRREIAVAQ